MTTLFFIIISTFIVSLVSFLGIFTISLNEKTLNKALFYMIALSVGGLLGGAFLHLLPEAIAESGDNTAKVFIYVLVGFFAFFLMEKILYWRHCHKGHCPVHTFAYLNLFGDAIHNFIDGLIIAASFVSGFSLGITSTIAIFLHEIPQEIGDFGVLIYGGFKRGKALFYNFLTALTAIGGGIVGYYLLFFSNSLSSFLVPFAAGGFIYIAASDLIPEIRKENDFKKSLVNLIILGAGILLMYFIKVFLEK